MYVIIIGAGEVGSYLATILVEEGHDVAIIEVNSRRAQELDGRLDGLVVQGSGLNKKTLEVAGIRRANLVLAVTEVDEVNLVACMTARKFGKDPMTIARVRDFQYLSEDSAMSAEELGLSLIVSPEHALAEAVMKLLSYDGSGDIHYMCDGQIALLELPITEESPMAQEPLSKLGDVLPKQSLVVAISDQEGLKIPDGSYVIGSDSRAHIVSTPDVLDELWILSGKPWHHVRHVLIIGCGNIGFYLAQQLEKKGFRPTIVEADADRAKEVSSQLKRSMVLLGDGTDPEILKERLEEKADAVVVLLPDDEKAMLVGLFAKQLGAHKVIVRNDKLAYAPIGHKMGLDALLSPKHTVADSILRFVRRGRIASAHMLGDHEAEILEIEVPEKAPTHLVDGPISDLSIPCNALIGAIIRKDKVRIPRGSDRLRPGDHLLVVGKPQDSKAITTFFS